MKKFLIIFSIFCFFVCLGTCTYATENETYIPERNFEEYIMMMQARQAKVDIIKKNNNEITRLKESLKSNITIAAEKVNTMNISISNGSISVSDQEINELKVLLEFLQQSTSTLNEEVEKVSREIESILDLIQTRGMDLAQYDLLIEKQNSVIVNMKNILETVNQI